MENFTRITCEKTEQKDNGEVGLKKKNNKRKSERKGNGRKKDVTGKMEFRHSRICRTEQPIKE